MIIGSQVATSVVQTIKINERYNNVDDLDMLAESGISLSKKYFLDEVQEKINSYKGNKIQDILDEYYSYSIDNFNGLEDYRNRGYGVNVSITHNEVSSSDLTGVFSVICKATWNGIEKQIEDTISISLNQTLVDNKDIEIAKGGFLTQQSYNVDHMANIGNNQYNWSNRLHTYMKDAGLSQFVSAEISNEYTEYTNNKIGDKNPDNSTTNTVFTSHDSKIDEYKEAKKVWGYFRAPRDGWYRFATYADDGISVKFDGITIIDNFKPKSAGYDYNHSNNNNLLKLEEGKFYPIYIEYFNWGGKAKFYLLYNIRDTAKELSNDINQHSKVPASCFYPSRNPLPPY